MTITIARVFLALNGLVLAAYGIYCTFNPMILAEYTNMGLESGTAVTEVRAMYGGLQFTVGLYFLLCGLRKTMTANGLLVSLFVFAGLAGARAYGLTVDGEDNGYNFSAVIYETVCGLLSVVLLRLISKQTDS